MNTGIMTGTVNEAFLEWKRSFKVTPIHRSKSFTRHAPGISPEEAAAYEAFSNQDYKAGVRKFPDLVATREDFPGVNTSLKALTFWNEQWSGPTFMAVGMQDDMLGPEVMGHMKDLITGCPEPLEIPQAGHFVQEHGDLVATQALQHFGLID